MSFISQTGMGMGGNGNKRLITGREWELNLRHHGNGIGNGNELMGMGGNGMLQAIPAHLYSAVRQQRHSDDLPLLVRGPHGRNTAGACCMVGG